MKMHEIMALWAPYQAAAMAEGWDLFETTIDRRELQVQMDDEADMLANDDEAKLLVRTGTGEHHAKARELIALYSPEEWEALRLAVHFDAMDRKRMHPAFVQVTATRDVYPDNGEPGVEQCSVADATAFSVYEGKPGAFLWIADFCAIDFGLPATLHFAGNRAMMHGAALLNHTEI